VRDRYRSHADEPSPSATHRDDTIARKGDGLPDNNARGWLAPTLVVLGCLIGTVLLTGGLGQGAEPGEASGASASPPVRSEPTGRAPGPLSELLPAPAELGYGWESDDTAASQQVTDGPGLLHPCGVSYDSDRQRVEVLRSNVAQNSRDVPAGMAMTFELARYRGDGASRALQERVGALAECAGWRTTFAGYADTPVDVALIAPPAGGSSTGAHLAVTPATSVGLQAVEYTYLAAVHGDVLLSAVVGNGNGQGAELDAFADRYFQQARSALAGRSGGAPEDAGTPALTDAS
jgi:hypothetical protein